MDHECALGNDLESNGVCGEPFVLESNGLDNSIMPDGINCLLIEIPYVEASQNAVLHEVAEFILIDEPVDSVTEQFERIVNASSNVEPDLTPLMEETNDSDNQENVIRDEIIKINTRKRLRNLKKWKKNIRKDKYQAGEEHVNSAGKLVGKKKVANRKDCWKDCKLKCSTKLAENDRNKIFLSYYKLDQDRKYDFLIKFTKKSEIARKTKIQKTKRQYTYKYFFEVKDQIIQVCKEYFLGTLSISQTPIYTAHSKKKTTGVVQSSERGAHNKSRISDDDKAYIIKHISSFPIVESHYRRSLTSKQYLDSNLNINKMYDLYQVKCEEENMTKQKPSYYRNIFCTKFNLDFYKPRSDRCATCEIYTVAKRNNKLTTEIQSTLDQHNKIKQDMYETRKLDKVADIPVLCFDLQNVLTVPKTEVGPAYYLSKLNMYNLTAHLSFSRQAFCCIWTECTGGRSGNDIASAFLQILQRVFETSPFTRLVTWSDSCVPQNKNSHIAAAILYFINAHPEIEEITMKYSVPGHSAIQEVDNIHSQIEKVLRKSEYYSPMPLIRLLKLVNRKRPFSIIQMKPQDFKNFAEFSKANYNFKDVPFSKLKMIRFTKEKYTIQYSNDYDILNLTSTNVQKFFRRTNTLTATYGLSEVKRESRVNPKKAHDLQQMFNFMSEEDKAFYRVILKLDKPQEDDLCEDALENEPTANIAMSTVTSNTTQSTSTVSPRNSIRGAKRSSQFQTPKGRKISKIMAKTV